MTLPSFSSAYSAAAEASMMRPVRDAWRHGRLGPAWCAGRPCAPTASGHGTRCAGLTSEEEWVDPVGCPVDFLRGHELDELRP